MAVPRATRKGDKKGTIENWNYAIDDTISEDSVLVVKRVPIMVHDTSIKSSLSVQHNKGHPGSNIHYENKPGTVQDGAALKVKTD